MIDLKTKLSALAIALGAFCGAGPATAATTFGFSNIVGGDSTAGDSLVGNFSLTISQIDMSQIAIQISSAMNAGSYFIRQIFFDDIDAMPLLSSFPATNSATYSTGIVNFVNSGPGNFAQGQNLTPSFDGDLSYTAATPSRANGNSIQPGETGGFVFTGQEAALAAAINANTFRVGIRVQGIGEASDSFVSKPNPPMPPVSAVPVPAAGMLLVAALGGLGLAGRRKPA